MKVTIQLAGIIKDWNQAFKVEHTFKNWDEIAIFCYRLALHFEREVRVEYKGNGTYYNHHYAKEYLDGKK